LVRREDGEEVSRKLTKTEISEEPTEEIIEVGTKVVVYGSGEASWYIKSTAMIGACNLVSRGTKVHVVNISNGKSVDIVTSGGGEFSGMGRVVDLSTAAFQALGASLGQGTIGNVRVEKYYPES
jgi:rare lipoprotein A (peptidoglycan hydrolase)